MAERFSTQEFFIFLLLAILALVIWSFWDTRKKFGLRKPQILGLFAFITIFLSLFPPILFNDGDLLIYPAIAVFLFPGFLLLFYARDLVFIKGTKGLSPGWISGLTWLYRTIGLVFFALGLMLLLGTIFMLLGIGEP